MTRSGAATRSSVSVVRLFVGVGSGPLVPSSRTEASLVMEEAPAGMEGLTETLRVRVVEAPAAREPRFQVTAPLAKEPPLEAETKEVKAGRRSVTETPVAS